MHVKSEQMVRMGNKGAGILRVTGCVSMPLQFIRRQAESKKERERMWELSTLKNTL